jgi:hypothetical protein
MLILSLIRFGWLFNGGNYIEYKLFVFLRGVLIMIR